MLNQAACLTEEAIQVKIVKVSRGHAREIEQRVDDFTGAERLLGNLVEQFRLRIVTGDLLCQHLRIRGNDGERCVHFMSDSSRKQTDGRELVGLHQLALKLSALRYVVENHQASDLLEILGNQRGDSEVHHEFATRLRSIAAVTVGQARNLRLQGELE